MSDIERQKELDRRVRDQSTRDMETLFSYARVASSHKYGQCQVDYHRSNTKEISGAPFYALIMAAMRNADTFNAIQLRKVFPELWLEMRDRYDAPRGLLDGEHDDEYNMVNGQLISKLTGEVVR